MTGILRDSNSGNPVTGREEKQNQSRLANLMAEKARETRKTV